MAADTFHCTISDGVTFIRKSTSSTIVQGLNLSQGQFSVPVQTGPGAHPASCTMGIGYLSQQ